MSTQRTDTVNKVKQLMSISRTNLSNKSTRMEKPSGIEICKENPSVSVLSGNG